MREFDKAFEKLLPEMKAKIEKNSHKDDWLDDSLYNLMVSLFVEVQEARDAYREYAEKGSNRKKQALIAELADVANYCAFIVDKLK